MTTEGNGKGTGDPGAEAPPPAGETPCCGPECGCGTAAGDGGRKLKIAVSLAVAVAACAILLYKATTGKSRGSAPGSSGFSTGASESGPGGTSGGALPCTPLPSIAALNSMAADLETVFILVPGKDNGPPSNEMEQALASAEKTLAARGIRTARYSLQPDSPDYESFAAQVPPPGIAVLSKGKGVGVVSGPVTGTSVMQAYVASTSGGGCCPPGGASPGKCP